jgi:hypothetical protein
MKIYLKGSKHLCGFVRFSDFVPAVSANVRPVADDPEKVGDLVGTLPSDRTTTVTLKIDISFTRLVLTVVVL